MGGLLRKLLLRYYVCRSLVRKRNIQLHMRLEVELEHGRGEARKLSYAWLGTLGAAINFHNTVTAVENIYIHLFPGHCSVEGKCHTLDSLCERGNATLWIRCVRVLIAQAWIAYYYTCKTCLSNSKLAHQAFEEGREGLVRTVRACANYCEICVREQWACTQNVIINCV